MPGMWKFSNYRLRARFSLRMMFVAVTIIGIALGWSANRLNWIRQRHEFLENTGIYILGHIPKDETSWSMRLFGERQIERLQVPKSLLWKGKLLFPEADVGFTDWDESHEALVWHTK
jgi:hypothetical protein